MRKILTPVLIAAIAVGSAAACDDDELLGPDEEFEASLTGAAEVPPVQTNATGSAEFTFDDGVMTFSIDVQNITGVIAAHIHGPASPGANAGVLATLLPGQAPSGDVNGELVSGTFTQPDQGSGMTMAELVALMESGQTYVNVHTEANPGGEIRGQISED